MTQVVFLVLPQAELLDFAGPAQAFSEANDLGGGFTLRYAGLQSEATSAQGLRLHQLEPIESIVLNPDDLLFVPGLRRPGYHEENLAQLGQAFFAWLGAVHQSGAQICSVCTGAFVLGYAGLLNGRFCTTHWQCTTQLQEDYPQAKVLADRLFVEDSGIYSSAGIASGIDLALAILEARLGPLFTAKVARSLVVYIRRDGAHPQQSIYLAYRSHLSPVVHEVQDWLIAHPSEPYTLEKLADRLHLSSRHLTRLFKQATGITIATYATLVKIEHAQTLLKNPNLTIEAVAQQCGFKDARQLRRLWQKHFGYSPSQQIQ